MFEFIVEKFGSLMGWCIVVFFGLAIFSYVIKFVNKRYGKTLRQHETYGKYYDILFKSIIKYHKVFGSLTIVFIAIHFTIFFILEGLVITGLIAAILMLIIILQGAYGNYVMKKRSKVWLYGHRFLAVILIFAILIHIL